MPSDSFSRYNSLIKKNLKKIPELSRNFEINFLFLTFLSSKIEWIPLGQKMLDHLHKIQEHVQTVRARTSKFFFFTKIKSEHFFIKTIFLDNVLFFVVLQEVQSKY